MTTTDLRSGPDFRRPELRRDVFLRFYAWSLYHRSFPGGVHYALPYMAQQLGLDPEQRAWLAFLNGNTQNPVTTLLLFQAAPYPELSGNAVGFWELNYRSLQWDTDRRYHKARFGLAVQAYRERKLWGPEAWFNKSWGACWKLANQVPFMGRLSAWSYLEYLRILGLGVPDADTLMLEDTEGSRSHRNGLCLVTGHDDWIADAQLGRYTDRYSPDMLQELARSGRSLLSDTLDLMNQLPPLPLREVPAAGNLSLESALCTFKSWHKRNRRYPGVYNDMLYDRIRHGEIKFGYRFGLLWDARRASLPSRLLLEDNPADPGCVPVKQNWFLDHGEVINMTSEWPCFANGFEAAVQRGDFGRRAVRWI